MKVDVKQRVKTILHNQLTAGDVFCEAAHEHDIWYLSLGNGNHVDLRDGKMYSDKLFGARPLLPGRITGLTVEV